MDPSDVEAGRGSVSDGEMTSGKRILFLSQRFLSVSGVGTSLYVAPEVLHGKGKNHSKADMYSLGVSGLNQTYSCKGLINLLIDRLL